MVLDTVMPTSYARMGYSRRKHIRLDVQLPIGENGFAGGE